MAMPPKNKPIYRVTFIANDNDVYEVYVRSVRESDLFSFLEVEDFLFDPSSSVLLDPTQERLAQEFADVKRSYIPAHSIIRIDEVTQEGVAKIKEIPGSSEKSNVRPFPKAKIAVPIRGKDSE